MTVSSSIESVVQFVHATSSKAAAVPRWWKPSFVGVKAGTRFAAAALVGHGDPVPGGGGGGAVQRETTRDGVCGVRAAWPCVVVTACVFVLCRRLIVVVIVVVVVVVVVAL
jgi:hypothetical protein